MIIGVGVGGAGPCAQSFVRAALRALADDEWWSLRAVSEVIHSAPAGGVTHARFANAAALIETALHPEAVLGRLLAIERRYGRVRTVKNAARSLDLDILWTSGAPRRSPRLVTPHPALLTRPFARGPLKQCFALAGVPLPGLLSS